MSGSDFQHLLGEYQRGESERDALHPALLAHLAHAPHDAPALRSLLEQAREQGLDRDLYQQLRAPLDAVGAPDQDTGDRTRILPGGTGGKAMHAAGAGDRTVVQTGSPATGPAAPTAAPAAAPAAPAPQFAPGYVIKDRFRLVEVLGEGGMGTVWKAVDKLKEEARDRNPFVAVKLLAGDFRNHPEAFIALQRESAKQQRLAHPNIATVYDFDRDGDTVYMTMEVMTGTPMDRFINALPDDGLPYEEAMPIIDELGAGLAYAHQANLVHSDLKPGNAFLTRDKHVKLLDFGIARASKTRTDAEGEKTLFDPGQLGALTPTYASIEMFEGMEPDARDDIYALAIIAYQLLAGAHPFARKSAPKAKELGLVPAPIAKLTRRQNRALLRGLAFERDARTPSVEEFLDGLRPYKNKMPWIVGGSIAAAILIAVLAYKPVIEHFEQQQREAIIEVFMQGGQENIDRGMAMVAALEDAAQREAIAADARTRKAIIELHVTRARQHFDPATQRWDHAAALAVMDELAALYPDSAEVLTLRTELEREKSRTLDELAARYTELLARGALIPDAHAEDIGDVRARVQQIDPDNALLADPRLPARIDELARAAMAADDWQQADRVLAAGRELVGEHAALAPLRTQVDAELARLAEQRRIAELEARLESHAFASFADYDAVRDSLRELIALQPDHPLPARLAPGLADAFAPAFARRLAAGDRAGAQASLFAWAPLLGIEQVRTQRAALDAAGASVGDAADLRARVQRIEALLADAALDAGTQARLRAAFAELLALAGDDHGAVGEVRARIGAHFIERARAARDAQRFDDALAVLARAAVFAPGDGAIENARQNTLAAREALREREAQARRLARIQTLRETLLAHAQAGRIAPARALLEELRAELPDGDPFLAAQAPEAIARAVLREARAAFDAGEPEAALASVRAALDIAPQHAALQRAGDEYRGALVAQALALQSRRVPEPGAIGTATAASRQPPAFAGEAARTPRPALAQALTPDAARYPALGDALAGTIAERIEARAREAIRAGEWRLARDRLAAGRELVGEHAALAALRAQVDAELVRLAEQRRIAELETRLESHAFASFADYDAVRDSLRELIALQPDHPLPARLAPGLADVFAPAFARRLAAGDRAGAQASLLAWAPLLGIEQVRTQRAALTAAGGGSVGDDADLRARVQRIEALLADAALDAGTQARLRAAFAELLALAGDDHAAVGEVRTRIGARFIERARAARDAQRFDDALALLARAAVFAPDDGAIENARQDTLAARQALREREAQARRLARIQTLRETLLAHAQAGRIAPARALLEELRGELPDGDPFLAAQAPEAIARAVLREARAAFDAGEPEAALASVRAALDITPQHAALQRAGDEYRSALVARALALQSRRVPEPGAIGTATGPSRQAAAGSAGIRRAQPPGVELPPADSAGDRTAALSAAAAARIAERIAAGAQGSPREVAAIAQPAAGFNALFPQQHAALLGAIEQVLAARLDRLARSKDVKNHNALLASARRIPVLRGRAEIEGPKASRLIAQQGLAQLEDGALAAALQTADRVAAEQPDATDLAQFRAAIATRQEQAAGLYEQFQRYEKARRLPAAKRYLERAIALWSDNPRYLASLDKLEDAVAVRRGACVASLAGYGRRQRGTCHDQIAGGKGPEMVVVPGANGAAAFAIGKYEVTLAQFNRYCTASGECRPRAGSAGLPATGVSLADMRRYAQWLSRQAGATYRLPTEAEWEHAASAGGEQQRQNYNCRVTQGGAVVAGHSLVGAESGQQNGWGLVHHVGNAREVVTTANGVAARGGAYTDPLVKCAVGLREADAALPDEATGFRLLRELG